MRVGRTAGVRGWLRRFAAVLLGLFWMTCGGAAEPPPVIAIILDDLGNNLQAGRQALELPSEVTLAFLPHTPHAQILAEAAHKQGNVVMLHLPMESKPWHRLGPGGLTANMNREELLWVLAKGLEAIPFAAGVNNHMGSRLTARAEPMDWLMRDLGRRGGLFFVDSRTTAQTVAWRKAAENEVPSTSRDVFLDNTRTLGSIRHQFNHLLETARNHGQAVGIGHPYPETLQVLAEVLPELAEADVELVAVTDLIESQKSRRQKWQAPSSPSLKVAKNSKP